MVTVGREVRIESRACRRVVEAVVVLGGVWIGAGCYEQCWVEVGVSCELGIFFGCASVSG